MILIRKIAFIIFGSLILMSSKCTQTKAIFQESPEFRILNAYSQKLVPGEKNQKPYIEFGFELEGITNKISLDSVFCQVGKSLKITTDGKKRLKLMVNIETIDVVKFDKAIFYYTQEDSKYYYVLNNIKIKEEMLLP